MNRLDYRVRRLEGEIGPRAATIVRLLRYETVELALMRYRNEGVEVASCFVVAPPEMSMDEWIETYCGGKSEDKLPQEGCLP